MSLVKLNKSSFSELVNQDKPVLIDFYADWCGPCRMVSPVIEEIAGERSDVVVGKVNVDSEPELAREFSVYSIPTLVVLRDGREVSRRVGAGSKDQILEMLR